MSAHRFSRRFSRIYERELDAPQELQSTSKAWMLSLTTIFESYIVTQQQGASHQLRPGANGLVCRRYEESNEASTGPDSVSNNHSLACCKSQHERTTSAVGAEQCYSKAESRLKSAKLLSFSTESPKDSGMWTSRVSDRQCRTYTTGHGAYA